jgi:hypothetical protein
MNLKLGVDKVYAEMEEDYEDCVPEVSLEEAINIIQRNERGRQGKARALLVKRVRESEKRDRLVAAAVGCRSCVFQVLVLFVSASCLTETRKSQVTLQRTRMKLHLISRRCFAVLWRVVVLRSPARRSWCVCVYRVTLRGQLPCQRGANVQIFIGMKPGPGTESLSLQKQYEVRCLRCPQHFFFQ